MHFELCIQIGSQPKRHALCLNRKSATAVGDVKTHSIYEMKEKKTLYANKTLYYANKKKTGIATTIGAQDKNKSTDSGEKRFQRQTSTTVYYCTILLHTKIYIYRVFSVCM